MVARTGHFDRIVISDAGFPIPAGVPCIDLSMGPNMPKVTDVLKMLTLELPIEQFWFAKEIQPSADERAKELSAIMTKAECIPPTPCRFQGACLRCGRSHPYRRLLGLGQCDGCIWRCLLNSFPKTQRLILIQVAWARTKSRVGSWFGGTND